MPKETFITLHKDKKERIIKGITIAFTLKQYDAVTVSDIVKHAKIPRGSFYQYFNDKFDCFMTLLEVIKEEKMHYLKAFSEGLGKESLLFIYLDLVKGGLAFAKDYPDYFKIGAMLFTASTKEVQAVIDEMEKMSIEMLVNLLKIDQQAGILAEDVDLEIIAKMLYNFNAKDVVHEVIKGKSHAEVLLMIEGYLNIIKFGAMKG